MHYPKHVAIIPDGNRTRAKENNVSTNEAYLISYQRAVELIKHTFTHTDTDVFTLRGLSTENARKRPKEEFDFLMTMYQIIDGELDDFLLANNINFKRIGNPDGITEDFKEYLEQKEEKTKSDTSKYLLLWINYGGRDEIISWIKKFSKQYKDKPEELAKAINAMTEDDLTKHLQLNDVPPIELVIRTKWDQAHRTSGFMSRWIWYAELYFTNKCWPEFRKNDFFEAILDFQKRKRRFGKVNSQIK